MRDAVSALKGRLEGFLKLILCATGGRFGAPDRRYTGAAKSLLQGLFVCFYRSLDGQSDRAFEAHFGAGYFAQQHNAFLLYSRFNVPPTRFGTPLGLD